jgi:hypothetical protein
MILKCQSLHQVLLTSVIFKVYDMKITTTIESEVTVLKETEIGRKVDAELQKETFPFENKVIYTCTNKSS